jgi:hypothetical protein
MPQFEDEFKFPDEIESEKKVSAAEEDDIEVEIIDDTPEEDRQNAAPMPKDIVDELESDELEEYSEKAKMRLKQLKKVWNDERRAKEAAAAEQAEAVRVAQLLIEENKKLKGRLSDGEKTLVSNHKEKLERELADAKKEFKDAYDSGDADRLADAQERLTDVKFKSAQAEAYKPEFENTLQEEEIDVQSQQPQRLDPKTQAWLDKNSWYGVDQDMSYLAMGVHRRLQVEGVPVGSDNYFKSIDAEMRRRFPEKFEDQPESKNSENTVSKNTAKVSKPSTVVAPATRSTSPKKITLTQRQLNLAKKFKLTPEQYARELTKLESQNG